MSKVHHNASPEEIAKAAQATADAMASLSAEQMDAAIEAGKKMKEAELAKETMVKAASGITAVEKTTNFFSRMGNGIKTYALPTVKVVGLVGIGAAGMYAATQYKARKSSSAEITSVTV